VINETMKNQWVQEHLTDAKAKPPFSFVYDGKASEALLAEWPKKVEAVKPFLWGDFYPLTDCDIATDRVLAYQLARPDLGRGVIFAFRRQDCETASFRVTPELEKGVRYVLEDIEDGKPLCITGGEPFDIAIADKRGSRLIMYREDTRAGTSAANSI